jgi:Domain of Unknown Function (DUF928)
MNVKGWVLVGLSLAVMAVLGYPTRSDAQQFKTPPTGSFKAPRSTLPGRQAGAGVRGFCFTGGEKLLQLMPAINPILTTQETPSFFWYLPPAAIPTTGELVVSNDADQELYKSTVQLSPKAGIISLRLPQTLGKRLKVGETYKLQFSQVCEPPRADEAPEIRYVESWFQRVTPSPKLTKDLKAVPAQSRNSAALYAANGIWENAITTLYTLRLQRSGDQFTLRDWTVLLESAGLSDLTKQPLLDCCKKQEGYVYQ